MTVRIAAERAREKLSNFLSELTPRQRRVVRSYLHNVMYGRMTLTEWSQQDQVPRVSLATWRKRFDEGGNYWGTDDSPNPKFRNAVKAYSDTYGQWRLPSSGEEEIQPFLAVGDSAPEKKQNHIYLIREEWRGLIKIGIAANVMARLNSLQTSAPQDLTLIGYFPTNSPVSVERHLHQRFEHRHHRGEWYELTEDDIRLILDYCDGFIAMPEVWRTPPKANSDSMKSVQIPSLDSLSAGVD